MLKFCLLCMLCILFDITYFINLGIITKQILCLRAFGLIDYFYTFDYG
jgi:hypothetical protein